MKLFKKKAFLSLLLIFTLLFFNINSVFATSSHLKTEDEFIVDLVMVDEMINSLTDQELNDNPYLSAVIGDMKKIVKEEENITLSKLKSRLYMKDSYKNHQKSKFQSLHENEKKAMTQEDKEQLERVDKLAKKYYDYYIEHGTFPKESKGEVQILSLGSFVTRPSY